VPAHAETLGERAPRSAPTFASCYAHPTQQTARNEPVRVTCGWADAHILIQTLVNLAMSLTTLA